SSALSRSRVSDSPQDQNAGRVLDRSGSIQHARARNPLPIKARIKINPTALRPPAYSPAHVPPRIPARPTQRLASSVAARARFSLRTLQHLRRTAGSGRAPHARVQGLQNPAPLDPRRRSPDPPFPLDRSSAARTHNDKTTSGVV